MENGTRALLGQTGLEALTMELAQDEVNLTRHSKQGDDGNAAGWRGHHVAFNPT